MFKPIATARFDHDKIIISSTPNQNQPRCTPTVEGIPKMVTIRELANSTGISESHIRKLCKENKITYIKVGVKYLINENPFIDYLNGKI